MIYWNEEKARKIQNERNIDVAKIADLIISGTIAAVEKVPNQKGHPDQLMFIIMLNDYAHCVPFVIEENGDIFIKTVFKSRAMQKKYSGRTNNEEKNKSI